jgi:hypothetical protein
MDRRMVLGMPVVAAMLATSAQAEEKIGLPTLGAPDGGRLVFPTDETFWFEISRSFGNAEYGGTLMGEVLSAASAIKEGDFESWYAAFNTLADRVAGAGEEQLKRGHKVSARDSFLRASSYYFTSEFFLHGKPQDPRIARAYRQSVGNYKQACALFEVPILPVEIPYEGRSLPGYWHRPSGPDRRRPTLICHSGFDGSAEEIHFNGVRAAVERGYNVLAFDGPGQYGSLHRDGLTFRPDWENVITPVVDWVLERPEVDPKRIVYLGKSLGGVLAPRAAAFEHRLAALVANNGVWDFNAALLTSFPQERRSSIVAQIKAPSAPGLDRILEGTVNGTSSRRWVFQHGMWAMGVATPREFLRKTLDYNLRDGIAEKISCPTMVCVAGHAANADQAQELYDHLTCQKVLMRFTIEEGAGAHTQTGASRLAFARIFDWVDETIGI